MSDEQVKIMYFGPRPEGRSAEDFRERWRQHGELAMGLPFWRLIHRYQQFQALTEGERGLSAGHLAAADPSIGGVGSCWYRGLGALDEQFDDADVETMAIDEIETFGRRLGDSLVAVQENRVIDRGSAALTVLGAIWAPEGTSRESFSQQWRDNGPRVTGTPELERHLQTYVQNHALPVPAGGPIPGAAGPDGIVELGFDTPEAIAAFFQEPKFTDWLAPIEAGFIDAAKTTMIIAAEQVRYDDPSVPTPAAAVAS